MLELSLQPKQEQLLRAMERTGIDTPTILGWGGARGAAKSGGLRRINLARRFTHPGTKSIIIRRVYGDLKENHIDKYLDEYPELRQFYRVGDAEFILPTGKKDCHSRVAFGHAQNLEDVRRKFMGPEYYDIFVDQAEQFSEQELRIIKTSNRAPNTKPGECKLVMFFNPGGIGTEYLRRIFSQKRYKEYERASDFEFIQAYGWDNFVWFDGLGCTPREFYALSNEERFALFIEKTQYGRDLNALPPALRSGHLLGNFDSFENQYFAGVWDESRLILSYEQQEALIQPWWPRWIAIDWGYAHHSCVLWGTVGTVQPARFKQIFGLDISEPVEIVVVYRELVVQEMEEAELGRQIVDLTPADERKLVQRVYLDPSAKGERRGFENSIAEILTDELRRGKLPAPCDANNDRIPGWRFVYGVMKQANSVWDKPPDSTLPLLFIGPLCREVIEAVPLAVRNDKNPGKLEDVLKTPTKADDVLDCLRYLLKSHLDAKATPIPVLAMELSSQYTPEQPHEHAMAMMKFEHDHKQARRRRSSWARS